MKIEDGQNERLLAVVWKQCAHVLALGVPILVLVLETGCGSSSERAPGTDRGTSAERPFVDYDAILKKPTSTGIAEVAESTQPSTTYGGPDVIVLTPDGGYDVLDGQTGATKAHSDQPYRVRLK